MCNPNSTALAYRRQRAASVANPQLESTLTSKIFQGGFTASLLLRNTGFPDEAGAESTGFSAPTVSYSSCLPWPETFQNAEIRADSTVLLSLPSSSHTNSPEDAPRKVKRRRKPQKPGKTAKLNDRHFVVHNYHDHGNDSDNHEEESTAERRRGGVSVSFPQKMHSVLAEVEKDGLSHVIAWQPHGRCFVIHKPKEFTDHVMPHYFRQTKLTSFQRQLNLYGFNRITRGADAGGYYHELFLRGKEFLCKHMVRTKVKGTRFKAASSPEHEPDFSTMSPVIVTPGNSDCDLSDASASPVSSCDYQPRIGDPERYQPYQTKAQVSQYLPVPHPGTTGAIFSAAPMLACASFDSQESPRAVAAVLPNYGMVYDQGVLDQAVEDLFLGEGGGPPPEVNDSVMDFVTCWDPTSYGPDAALENDNQLGNLLDKLLWDEI